MSIFEIYELKENAIYPKSDFRDECYRILLDAEKNDDEWISAGEKAPTKDVLINILTKRTAFTNYLWKKALAKGLGFKNINELMGDERL